MTILPSQTIPGVRIVEVATGPRDARGSFTEVFRLSLLGGRPFVQENVSWSEPGVLRGLHLHVAPQADLWRVEKGRAVVVLADARGGRIGGVQSFILCEPYEDQHPSMVYIPSGVLHGFRAGPNGCRLRYLVDREFDGEHPDEYGVRWDDPEVLAASACDDVDALWWGAGWGRVQHLPSLSERDAHAPTLAGLPQDVLAALRKMRP